MNLTRLGHGIRALRRRRGWRQIDLARAARVSRSVVSRIERGDSLGVSVGDFNAVATALDATLDVALRWHGEAFDRLLDDDHASIVERLVAWLRAHGWDVAVEVSFSRYGERGSIDVLAFHPSTRALAIFEVKSVTPDMQAMLSGLDRKARLGPSIAKERGWSPASVARILVLADTSTNRRRLARFGSTVAAALPAGTWEVRHWLEQPTGRDLAGVWFFAHARQESAKSHGRVRVRVRSDQAPDAAG
ncbi:MAG: helix-turn-helix transcriptional regulator [Chloroflexota bacterium]